MTTSLYAKRRNSHSSSPPWASEFLEAGMTCESSTIQRPDIFAIDNSSDYGSDFSPEEQDALNNLLDRFNTNSSSAVPGNRVATEIEADFTPSQESALRDLIDTLPDPNPSDTKDVEIEDIEDYGEPQGIRVRKILGKEPWVPPWKRMPGIPDFRSATTSGNRKYESAETDESKARTRESNSSVEPEVELDAVHTRSPLERFRNAPRKALSVTDIVSPAWCEMQYYYSLSKHGRKRRTPAMKRGSEFHKEVEDQVHITVPVEVRTVEDRWGLRFWNMIQGLRTLRETGLTRELEILGLIEGEITIGIIDELSYTCPDPGLEASASAHYASVQTDRQALPEYQTPITDYLIDSAGTSMADAMLSPSRNQKVYISDLKTRTVPSMPSLVSFRPTQMQLSLYHHVLSSMTNPGTAIPLATLAEKYAFSPDTRFTDGFVAQVGTLNDVVTSSLPSTQMDMDLPASTQDSLASENSLSLLLSHNTPSSLYALLLTQFRLTFPLGAASISPVLTATYRYVNPSSSSGKKRSDNDPGGGDDDVVVGRTLGQKSVLFDQAVFDEYVRDEMRWWKGERETRGVDIDEAWKCQGCEFRDECVWISKREDELLEMKRAKMPVSKSAV